MELRAEDVKNIRSLALCKEFLRQAIELNDQLIEELRWRKCSEEMPDEDEGVLFSDGKYIYKGCWTTWDGGNSDFSYETFSGWVEDSSEHDFDFNEIKYWMPLPSAPKDKENDV